MRALSCTLLALLLLASPAFAWQDTEDIKPAEEADAAPEEAADEEEALYYSTRKGEFVPGSMIREKPRMIPDVDRHRIEPLDSVPTYESAIRLDLASLDAESDPVLAWADQSLPRGEFRQRALIYLSATELDQHILRMVTANEIKRRTEAGKTVAVDVSEADIDKAVEDWIEVRLMQFQQNTAEMTPEELDALLQENREKLVEQIEGAMGMEEFRNLMRADAEFEAVFLPMPRKTDEERAALIQELEEAAARGETPPPPTAPEERPEWMPEPTWQAFSLSAQSRGMLGLVTRAAEQGSDINPLFKSSILSSLKNNLVQATGVQYWFDADLPDGVLVRVGGQDIMADDVWFLAAPVMTDIDAELITRETLALRAARLNLEEAGFWLEGEAWTEAWKAHEEEFEGSLLPLRTVIMFKGYHSVDRYREHYRYVVGYENMRRATLTDEEVLEHFQGGGRMFFEKGQMTMLPVFLPIDPNNFSNEAFAEASREMAEVIAEAGDDWSQVQEAFPWVDNTGNTTLNRQRNMLRIMMNESELSEMITGYGFVMDLFYHGEPGEVYGPYENRCRFHQWANPGVWAVKVVDYERLGQLPPFKDAATGRAYELAYADYLNITFYDWLNRGLAAYAGDLVIE